VLDWQFKRPLAIWQNSSSLAGVIDLASFNAISVSTAALASSLVTVVAPVSSEKLPYSHDILPEWPTESQKAIMLEAFTLTAVSGQARPSRKLAAAPVLLRVAHV
jgi:hypothetical protein